MYPWGHDRRFNSYSEYFKKRFGQRVQKITINAGFTCPNRDGSKGTGGCSYCNNDSFVPSYCKPGMPFAEQISEGKKFHKIRYDHATKYLAYFQSYSNTYRDLDSLKKIYLDVLSDEDIVGLVVGTRPDCVDDEKLDFFSELSEQYYVIIEYGIESCYNASLERINRQHDFATTVNAITETARRGIHVGGHIIFGLPGETRQQMLDESQILSNLPLSTIKFHQLQIIRGTRFEKDFEGNPSQFELFDMEEYMDFVIKFMEYLSPGIVVERFANISPPHMVVAPQWTFTKYDNILQSIEAKMKVADTWQGKYFTS